MAGAERQRLLEVAFTTRRAKEGRGGDAFTSPHKRLNSVLSYWDQWMLARSSLGAFRGFAGGGGGGVDVLKMSLQ